MNMAKHDDDRDLLLRARGGAAQAFGDFYRRHCDEVLAFLGRRVAEPEVAADLMAETFASLLVVVFDAERDVPERPIAWLFLTARNKLIDSVRRGRVESAVREQLALEPLILDDPDVGLIEVLSRDDRLTQRMTALLTPDELQAVTAHVVDGQGYDAIASELNCSTAVVRKRVSRGLGTLRASIRRPA
jgi:RNA polymerase sigma-70 factor (ECF subfamily)